MVDEKRMSQRPVYLSDQAAKRVTEDEFRHAEIAHTLKLVVETCPMPFTIGLFGGWGTGKTTISNFLTSELAKVPNVGVVVFDVWKFDKDSLRRQFLITVEKQLKEQKKLPSSFELDKALFTRVTKEAEKSFKFSWKKCFNAAWVYVLAVILVCSLWVASRNLAQAIGLGILMAVVLGLLQAISQATTVETTTTERDRLSEPDEFEGQFDEMLTKTENLDRLIIIIDNLDRCSHEKAVELLSTVKSFLEKPKCVYIVPCDEKAIKEHLSEFYKGIDTEEYLRKFFNTAIDIPDFIRSDLDCYTDKLLRETSIAELDDSKVSSTITTAYRENPRRIKQFINTLISHFLLAEQRESGASRSLHPDGVVTKNPAFLAKFLILRHNWPEFFEFIKQDPMILEEINLSYRGSEVDLPEKVKDMLNKDNELDDFLRGTQLITTKYPRAFLYLKQSREEQRIPESEDLRIALLDGKQLFIEDKFKTMKGNQDLLDAYENIVLDLLEKNDNRPERLFNIISLSIKASRTIGLTFSQNLCDKFVATLSNQLRRYLVRFDPEDVFAVLERCSATLRAPVVDATTQILEMQQEELEEDFVGVLDLTEYQRSLIKQIAVHSSWFEPKRSRIQTTIAQRYSRDLYTIDALCEDKKSREFFITPGCLDEIIREMAESDVQELKEGQTILLLDKVKILQKCESLMNSNLIASLLRRLVPIVQQNNPKPVNETKRQLLSTISQVLISFDLSGVDQNQVNSLSKVLLEGFNADVPITAKAPYVLPMILLVDQKDGKVQPGLDAPARQFLSDANPAMITELISELSRLNRADCLETRYKGILFQRATQAPDVFNSLSDGLSPKTRDELYVQTINSPQYEVALEKIKSVKFKVSNGELIANAVVDKSKEVGAPQKAEFFSVLIQLDCGDSNEVRDIFGGELGSLLLAEDAQSQELGYNYLREAKDSKTIPREKCKTIINDVIDVLDRREELSPKNEFVLRTITMLWSDLSLTHKDKFVSLIVYKLFEKNKELEARELGLSILSECKPGYDAHKSLLDHLLSLIEEIDDVNSKVQLAGKFLECKPEDIKKKDADEKRFWKRVEKLAQENPRQS